MPVCIWDIDNSAEVAVAINPAALAIWLDVPFKTKFRVCLLAVVTVAVVDKV